MRLSSAVVIKTNMSRPQSGKCFAGSHRLSVDDFSDGEIITFIYFILWSFKRLWMTMEKT